MRPAFGCQGGGHQLAKASAGARNENDLRHTILLFLL
jgi:hypothetical protein